MKAFEGLQNENKESKKFSDLTIFTTTLYGLDKTSETRQRLAEKFLDNCNKLNINCVVVDGGSNSNFIDKARLFKNVDLLIDPHLNMGDSRKEGLRQAIEKYNTPYFLWVEPEKDDLIKEESLLEMIKGLRENNADIIVPKRINTESYPEFQTWVEKRANERASKIMNPDASQNFDLWFGPKMFNKKGAKYFAEYKSVLNKWDTIIGPVIDAYNDGLKISSAAVDYKYDISQKEDEKTDLVMKRKRLQQYVTILKELKDPYWSKKNK